MFSIAHLDALRHAEIETILSFLTPGSRILELGAGTGKQSVELKKRGFDVVPIEISDSNYLNNRVLPILEYDGRNIPLADASVDIVFSSNVLEHVRDLPKMYTEIKRVLKPNGYCVHVLPTHNWRFWTALTHYADSMIEFGPFLIDIVPKRLPISFELKRVGNAIFRAAGFVKARLPLHRHGERGNAVSELLLFHPSSWRRNFKENGFLIVEERPIGLFYTGAMLLGADLDISSRRRLANILGSACHLFKIIPIP